MFEEGRNCWQVARADEMTVIVDAADYFATVRTAFLAAKKRIMLVGWDFDGRIGFNVSQREPDEPETISAFLLWLVERSPDLEVYLLRWDTGALKSLFRGSTAVTAVKWALHPRIHLKLDGHHPTGSSHHQKMVSIDDCLAFCGGIDMTGDRWDTRAHIHEDARRVQPNGTPYKPWHDATTALSGPIAAVVAQECRDRWERATGVRLDPIADGAPCWPKGLDPDFMNLDVALARTHPKMDDQEPVFEIEQLFVDQIARAENLIYMESQYFASRRIAEAIGNRLEEIDGPEVVIVNPQSAQGWFEPLAMDSARARLMETLQKRDAHGRLAIYHPFTSGGDPIYVHAKITIVDDRIVRIGSANLNNRSMRLDTECDVALDATCDQTGAAAARIAAIRSGLLAEHLGVAVDRFETVFGQTGSLIQAIERLRTPGRSLRPYEIPDMGEFKEWLADNEVLDPEDPDEMFEPLTKRGLFRWLSPPPE